MRIVTLYILLLCSFTTYAEPSKSVSYLMSEPVSLFDWGMFRLTKSIEEIRFDGFQQANETHSRVDYDWDTNVIEMTFIIYPKYRDLSNDNAQKLCRYLLIKVKGRFGYKYESDIRYLLSVKRSFEHSGYHKKDEPDSLMTDLETITKVTAKVFASTTDKAPFSQQVSCTSRLLDQEVYFLDDVVAN